MKYRFNNESNGRTLRLLTLVDKELQIKFRVLYNYPLRGDICVFEHERM
jgi:hypothetical protein